MNNILTYALTELHTFDEKPFNEVDSLILSWLTYLNFPTEKSENHGGLPKLKEHTLRNIWKGEYLQDLFGHMIDNREIVAFVGAVAASPRFRDVAISHFVSETSHAQTKQFAAITFHLADNLFFVAFRGTDSSFDGWKEDLNLALDAPIPSQMEAVEYLEEMAGKFAGSILVGGHSKGGNIAVFSSAFCSTEVQRRILQIFSHDGPGFSPEEVASEQFSQIRGRIHKIIPQSSLVGMLMVQECHTTIVHSSEKGIAQHDPFTWQVEGDTLVSMHELTASARLVAGTVNSWLDSLDEAERHTFINTVFRVLESTNAENFETFGAHLKENLPAAAKEAWNLDKDTKMQFMKLAAHLAATGARTVPQVMHPHAEAAEAEPMPSI